MIENDPRLVSIKGLKVEAADRAAASKDEKEVGPPLHDVTMHLESYFYNPANANLGCKPVTIPGEEQRLQDPAVKEAIAVLPARAARHVRAAALGQPSRPARGPPPAPRAGGRGRRGDRVRAPGEGASWRSRARSATSASSTSSWKALQLGGELFKADRLQGEVDSKVNELRGRLAQITQMKTITNPTLSQRVSRCRSASTSSSAARVPRETTVTRNVAEKTLSELKGYFDKHEYAEVSTLGSAWADYLKGKEIDIECRPVAERDQRAPRPRAHPGRGRRHPDQHHRHGRGREEPREEPGHGERRAPASGRPDRREEGNPGPPGAPQRRRVRLPGRGVLPRPGLRCGEAQACGRQARRRRGGSKTANVGIKKRG